MHYRRTNIPIAEVVIAFQPRAFGKSRRGVEPGRLALFTLGDPKVDIFDCFDGACWDGWRANPERQLGWMLDIKKRLAAECGISAARVESIFRHCREYREMRVEQRRSRARKATRPSRKI